MYSFYLCVSYFTLSLANYVILVLDLNEAQMYKSNISYGEIPFLKKLVYLFTISLPLWYTLDKFLPKMHCASFGSMFVVMNIHVWFKSSCIQVKKHKEEIWISVSSVRHQRTQILTSAATSKTSFKILVVGMKHILISSFHWTNIKEMSRAAYLSLVCLL